MTTAQHVSSPNRTIAATRSLPLVALCALGAGLLIASGVIHLHLWNEYYRHIKTGHMNVLFLVQWILCFVGAPGASFTVSGASPDRDAAIVGLGLSLPVAPAFDVFLRYDGAFAGNYAVNAGTAGLRIGF